MEQLYKKRYQKRKEEYSKYREIVAVFSSVSNETPRKFRNLCYELGKELSKNDYKISYGASPNGCNKWLMDGAEQTRKGNIRAVSFRAWRVNERIENPPEGMKTELVQTKGDDLHNRITELKKDALACVVLPGGPATFEELWNAVVGVAELNSIPVIILNIDGFFNHTKAQMDVMSDYFYWPKYNRYVIFADTLDEVINLLNTMRYYKIVKKGETPYRYNVTRRNRQSKRHTKQLGKKHVKKTRRHHK
jgi:predicted Rossmann-fold nucleotide-binding protein